MKILKKIFLITLVLSIIGLLSILILNIYKGKTEKEKDNEIVSELEKIIPKESLGTTEENANSILEIQSNSYTGIIEIPKLKLKYPVLSEYNDKRKFTLSQKKENKNLVITANNDYGRIDKLKELKEYDKIIFKNVRGETKNFVISSITNKNEEITNQEEDLIIKIKKYNSYLTIRAILER